MLIKLILEEKNIREVLYHHKNILTLVAQTKAMVCATIFL